MGWGAQLEEVRQPAQGNAAPTPTGRESRGGGSESPTSLMSVRKPSILVLPHIKIPKAKIYEADFSKKSQWRKCPSPLLPGSPRPPPAE